MKKVVASTSPHSVMAGLCIAIVNPFQVLPNPPKLSANSPLTKACAPSETRKKALIPTVGAVPMKVIFVRLLESSKAAIPILVTLSGIVMLVRLVQSLKAP